MSLRESFIAEIERQESLGFPKLSLSMPYVLENAPADSPNVVLFDHDEPFFIPRYPDNYFLNTLIVTGENELLELFDVSERYCNTVLADESLGDKFGLVKHESQHAEVARHLGKDTVRFAVTFAAEETYTVGGLKVWPMRVAARTFLEELTTTKLAIATQLVAPDVMSKGDNENLTLLGYKNKAEVQQLARQYNDQAGYKKYFV